jgi:hypothetical protein
MCIEETENRENATNTQTKSAGAEDEKCETDANIDQFEYLPSFQDYFSRNSKWLQNNKL